MPAYQFSNVVVGKNELCEAGQSLLQVLTNPTEEQEKSKVSFRAGISNGANIQRNSTTQSDTGRSLGEHPKHFSNKAGNKSLQEY